MKKTVFLFLFLLTRNLGQAQTKIWFDTDLMIGLSENAPREVDDAIALILALKQSKKLNILGISTVSNTVYAKKTALKIVDNYKGNSKFIPVYGGANTAADLGKSNEATEALIKTLEKNKLSIVAIGPLTNIATVLTKRPDLASQIEQIVVCAGRSENHAFKLGIGSLIVYDYNFEYDVEAFKILLEKKVKLVLAGFESSVNIILGKSDIDFLESGTQMDRWIHRELRLWQDKHIPVFGLPAFVAWDTTPLGYLTHPEYFKVKKDIKVRINFKPNEANVGPNVGEEKYFLEMGENMDSAYKVDFVYESHPAFEDKVLEILKKKK
jgi:inosine-uridine nucleoside N-ribohydrolase